MKWTNMTWTNGYAIQEVWSEPSACSLISANADTEDRKDMKQAFYEDTELSLAQASKHKILCGDFKGYIVQDVI